MPFRQRGSYGRRPSRLGQVIDSNKNSISRLDGIAAATKTEIDIALTVDAAANASAAQVTRGCKIFKFWMEMWVEGTADITLGTTYSFDGYIMKNPGDNLTSPTPGTQGTSNEKKFIFKTWKGLITNVRTNGDPFYMWKGWVKVPKIYQRMGADDTLTLVVISTGGAMLLCTQFIYKWFK